MIVKWSLISDLSTLWNIEAFIFDTKFLLELVPISLPVNVYSQVSNWCNPLDCERCEFHVPLTFRLGVLTSCFFEKLASQFFFKGCNISHKYDFA